MLFLRGHPGPDPATALWAVEVGSGAERLLADPADLLAAGPASAASAAALRSGITAYTTDPAARRAAFVLAGGLWTVEVGDGRVRRLPVPGPVADPGPDPSGRWVAYVSDGALRVIGTDGTGDAAIADPDGPEVRFGTAPHTGLAGPGGPGGYWWSPAGDQLLVARVDPSAVPLWPGTDPAASGRPVRYAAAGTANADVSLWLVAFDGAQPDPAGSSDPARSSGPRARTAVRWDRAAFEYLPGAGWDDHGPYAVVQSRDQRTVRLLEIDPADGRTTVRHEQRDRCWVQLVPGLPARTGSGALVAHADQPGTRQLTVDGVGVTPPGLQLRAVLGMSRFDGPDRFDGRDEVLFTASEEPTETHLWSWSAGGLRRLSAGPGRHEGVRRGGTLVRMAWGPDEVGGRFLVERAGRPTVPVASRVERPVLEVRASPLVLGPRRLRAVLHHPTGHRSGAGRLPILVDAYGGAGGQRATAERGWRSLVAQWFADQGFAVLVVDGAGTPGRGPAWEREVHGDLFGPVLDDQVTAVQEAARRYPDLDPGRVGIRGWSFGGSLAALAVLRRPDVFHAAVAGAGVTDQRRYHAYWRERFLGRPGEFPDRYEAASLVRAAPALRRPLLLMHGLADGTVHPDHTRNLSNALRAAGRPHEVWFRPGVGHQAIGGPGTEDLLVEQARFLRWHLGVAPRAGAR